MNFYSRRSIRKFKNIEVENEKLIDILKVALISPTGMNAKRYEYIVVKDKELIKKLAVAKKTSASFVKNAPVVIVVLSNDSITWEDDCSIASTMILLKAHELGLGTCWIQTKGRFNTENISTDIVIKDLLAIPEEFNVGNMIALGYPDEILPSHTEEDIDIRKIHFDKFKGVYVENK